MADTVKQGSAGRAFDWNLLHTFVVLAEAGSVTGAAERLGRKQPSVSNALRRLEEQIGKRLIDRSPGHFQLTDAGRLLHREALDIYGSVTRLNNLMRDVTDEIRGHVHIAMASHVVCPLFDDALRAFHETHPKATMTLDVMASVAALTEVTARRASLAICLVHERSAKLEYRRLYREFFGLFCGPGHPLFGRKSLSKADLKGHSSVSFLTDRLDDVLRPVALIRAEAGLDQHVVGRSSHLEEIRRMTIAGLGISALPVHVVARDVAEGLLWRLPPYDDPPAIDVHMVWNPMERMNRAEQAFVDALTAKIEETAIERRTYL
ncbi:MAG: LysR family transcriptional regulator [Rhizobiaceae bacterium]|nr:LysR family transcriptional regulator [Rhizobiaceae bacterium]